MTAPPERVLAPSGVVAHGGTDPRLLDRVRARLVEQGSRPDARSVAAALRGELGVRGDAQTLSVLRDLQLDLVGAGPLEPLLAQPGVTDVLVTAPDEVWVDDGGGLRRTPVRFADDAAVRRLAVRLATAAGRRLDTAAPCVDAQLPDGTRLHAVLWPVATRGTAISLRVLGRRVLGLDQLVGTGALTGGARVLLEHVLAARLAVVVSGGTGTGKTTLLGALLEALPAGERVVVVEDAAELRPSVPHLVSLQARPANTEGAGALPLRELVRQALRMRPDRLVVGEVRGAEVLDLLLALNTGHDGGLTTLHANSAADVPVRLVALAALAGVSQSAAHAQLAAGLHVVLHLVRDRPLVGEQVPGAAQGTGAQRRRLAEVAVVQLDRAADGLCASVVTALRFGPDGSCRAGDGLPRLVDLLAARGVTWAPGPEPTTPSGDLRAGRGGTAVETRTECPW